MAATKSFKIRANDYGHEWDFKLVDENGAIYVIPEAATVTFEAYLEGTTKLHVSDTAHVTIVDADAGHLRYTVQDGDWATSDEGTYYGRMVVNTITSEEVVIVCLPDQEVGA